MTRDATSNMPGNRFSVSKFSGSRVKLESCWIALPPSPRTAMARTFHSKNVKYRPYASCHGVSRGYASRFIVPGDGRACKKTSVQKARTKTDERAARVSPSKVATVARNVRTRDEVTSARSDRPRYELKKKERKEIKSTFALSSGSPLR